jgi:DNA-binding SARP family transcriptional activator
MMHEARLTQARAPDTRVQLMGGFAIVHAGRPVDIPDAARRLVAYLALEERPRERAFVASMLWPDKPEARASANLRSALWRLRTPAGVELIRFHRSALELAPNVRVDVRELQRLGWGLVHAELPGDAACEADRNAFVTELLPGWYDDWVIVQRERLTQLQLHFMEALTNALVHLGRVPDALDIAIQLVAADPLREGSQRALLRVYCVEGSLGQARRQLDRYRTELRQEFGIEPALTLESVLAECGPARHLVSN